MTEPAVCPLPTTRSHPLKAPDGTEELLAPGVRRVTFPNGVDTWLFSRYADVRSILADRRFSAYKDGDAPDMRPDGTFVGADIPGNMVIRDGAEHLRLRRPLARAFVMKRINELRPRIQQIVDEHLDAMERGGSSADLVESLCLPVPSLVIAELLGVPSEHQAMFQRFASVLLGLKSTTEDFDQITAELGAVITGLVEEKRANGVTDDLLGFVVNDDNDIQHEELLFLAMGLLAAGHETTANFFGLFVLFLFEHPDQLELVKSSKLSDVDGVVEELMRFTNSLGTGGVARRATENVEVGDVLVREGDWVVASLRANLDEELCPHAERLDVTRPSTPHVAFGFGPHQCLGQNLARVELQIMLHGLFTRFPNLKLARKVEDIPFRDDMLVYGAARIPVVW